MTRQYLYVKKQVIGIIQQHNIYIKSTSNLEGLKDFNNTHVVGGCFVGSPEVLDVRFAPPALGIKFAAITADSQVGFQLGFLKKGKASQNRFFSVKKGDFSEEKHLGFLKNHTCLRKKTRLFVDFPPMRLMFNWIMFCTMKNPELTQQQNNLPEKRPFNSNSWVFLWVSSYLGNSPCLFTVWHPMNSRHPMARWTSSKLKALSNVGSCRFAHWRWWRDVGNSMNRLVLAILEYL